MILDGSNYVKEGINGSWITMAGGGDVKKLSVANRVETCTP
ncbi:hypothetical protein [Streptomyces tailanensis]|nr:hypothetical protein [Streptomyces tailanensis]